MTVVAWERQAEVCAEYVQIGRRVGVEGRLHHSTWEVEGSKRSKVEVVAHRVSLLGAPRIAVSESSSDAAGAESVSPEGQNPEGGDDSSGSTDIATDTHGSVYEKTDALMPA
jgi:single-strand DNA-binding protein